MFYNYYNGSFNSGHPGTRAIVFLCFFLLSSPCLSGYQLAVFPHTTWPWLVYYCRCVSGSVRSIHNSLCKFSVAPSNTDSPPSVFNEPLVLLFACLFCPMSMLYRRYPLNCRHRVLLFMLVFGEYTELSNKAVIIGAGDVVDKVCLLGRDLSKWRPTNLNPPLSPHIMTLSTRTIMPPLLASVTLHNYAL